MNPGVTEAFRPAVPAWGAVAQDVPQLRVDDLVLSAPCRAEWSPDGGRGVRVCVVDGGVASDHPRIGPVEETVAIVADASGALHVEPDSEGDRTGHGTACASIIRSIAPACELSSVKVLSSGLRGSGAALTRGLEWAIERRFDVINLSLSTRNPALSDHLHALADRAYFQRTVVVASAHNFAVRSIPWTFSAVVSVASHDGEHARGHLYNDEPPVEFFAPGVAVDVAWLGGGSISATGNSFAAPYVAGLCARLMGAYRQLTPFEIKALLYRSARNVTKGSA